MLGSQSMKVHFLYIIWTFASACACASILKGCFCCGVFYFQSCFTCSACMQACNHCEEDDEDVAEGSDAPLFGSDDEDNDDDGFFDSMVERQLSLLSAEGSVPPTELDDSQPMDTQVVMDTQLMELMDSQVEIPDSQPHDPFELEPMHDPVDESSNKGVEETVASSRPVARPLQTGGTSQAKVIHIDDDEKTEPAKQVEVDLGEVERQRRIAELKAEILALESMQQKLQSSGWGGLGCLHAEETQSFCWIVV